MIIGVTGRYCSGKTTVAHILETVIFNTHAKNISVDKVGYTVLEEYASEIIEEFGPSIVHTDGTISRKALADIVFQDSVELEKLEHIVHPRMIEHVQSIIQHATSPIIIDAALLHYMGLHTLCDTILIVHSPFVIRMLRGKKRDTMSVGNFIRRNAIQKKTPTYWQYIFHKIYKKKALNLKRKSSELLVSGVLKYPHLEKKLYKIIEETDNETKL